MKLVSVRVTNFRSVEDSERFSLEQVTCLVGKNDAGKSAILLALAALNPHPSTPAILDKERDYPRRFLTAYSERHGKEEAVAIDTVWELTSIEMDAVALELGDGVFRSPFVRIKRRYESKGLEWNVDVDLQRAFDNALTDRGFEENQLAALRNSKQTTELIEKLANMPSLTLSQQHLLDQLKRYKSISSRVSEILTPFLPTFMYFSHYDRMDGAVQFEQINALRRSGEINKDEHNGARLFMEFLEHAGVIEDILGVRTYEAFKAKLQAASNNITSQIMEYWTQNPDLTVKVEIDPARPADKAPFNEGTIGRVRIFNQLHRVDTPFSERSAGFVWFFSFLVKFAQVKSQSQSVILLLDEPGMTLHGRAQGDLLRYFDEKLAPRHQIIYTTHSPFMVPPDKLMTVRMIEDHVSLHGTRRVSAGTKVGEDVLTTGSDTLFPLQGALAYQITKSLFAGKHLLLVEAASDILYLQTLSHALKTRNRTGLDARWTLCPCGGVDNVRSFVSSFARDALDLIVLVDHIKLEKSRLEELRRSEILKIGRLWTISQFTTKGEANVEDFFEPDVFVAIVNKAYGLQKASALTVKSLDDADGTTESLVKKVEAAFRAKAEPAPSYSRYTPAAWLVEHASVLEADSASILATLQRAERLFVALNATI